MDWAWVVADAAGARFGMGFEGKVRCVNGLAGAERRSEREAWQKGEGEAWLRARRGMVRSMFMEEDVVYVCVFMP